MRLPAGMKQLLVGEPDLNCYDKWIIPSLLDFFMGNREMTRYRSRLVPRARGVVLEVGVGSGLNLPFYGAQVQRLYAVDPSEQLLRRARERARSVKFPVEFFARSGDAVPLQDHSMDTVLITFSLCTIPDPLAALREMQRVLKPGGLLLFAEHGLASDVSVRRWQNRINPFWKRIAGGCNLNRKMDELISSANFRIEELTVEYARGPRPLSYIYIGSARPV